MGTNNIQEEITPMEKKKSIAELIIYYVVLCLLKFCRQTYVIKVFMYQVIVP